MTRQGGRLVRTSKQGGKAKADAGNEASPQAGEVGKYKADVQAEKVSRGASTQSEQAVRQADVHASTEVGKY